MRLKQSEENLQSEITVLKELVNQQSMAIKNQQSFLEKLDMKDRGPNLIITGVPEGRFLKTNGDPEKVTNILAIIGEHGTNFTLKRIGTLAPDKVRPLLVVTESTEIRNRIVASSKEQHDPRLTGIRIKRDTHPGIRREWKRLFDLKEVEENKPENEGRTITIDMKKRQVMRDDEVIESWNASLF